MQQLDLPDVRGAPDAGEQVVVRADDAGRAHQLAEQRGLDAGEGDAFVADEGEALADAQAQRAGLEDVALRHGGADPAEGVRDAGGEHPGLDRLVDVVVGAGLQQHRLALGVAVGGEHDDGHGEAAPAPALEQFGARAVGERDVEQDEVRRGLLDLPLGFDGIAGQPHGVAGPFEDAANQDADARVVVHDEDGVALRLAAGVGCHAVNRTTFWASSQPFMPGPLRR